MLLFLEVVCVILTAVAMSLALAHALELPGKRRLDQDAYRMVQTIYYPGFTIGGFAEVLGMVALAALLWAKGSEAPGFGWTGIALLALAAMHAVYWVLTHPVNKFWLADHKMSALGTGFFGTGAAAGPATQSWRQMRDRWELSHVIRAVLAMLSLVLLTVAVAL